jgi:hypothetical protein
VSTYRVYLNATASFYVNVEAEDEDSAIDKAYEMAPREVCAHCSGWGQAWGIDLGEWEADDNVDEVNS